jgi:chromosome segregation protein
VYVKRLELSYFKSFGSTATIPLLPGFTVISGPNGSGKSNLLDAMLFALGLSGSKGMRAERLPDLVNQAQIKRGHSIVETKVTVTFAVDEADLAAADLAAAELSSSALSATPDAADVDPLNGNQDDLNGPLNPEGVAEPSSAHEWEVTRKLRVTKQGTYTSTYAINGEPCTLAELHERMNRLRIYPEGYNVVLQGDVTGIISMNGRQRREIIDELAGVANFDRKINQAREKLDAVKEQEDRYRIVEQELQEQCERLDRDRIKAQKYQLLRAELNDKSAWEHVLAYRHLQQQIQQQQEQLQAAAQQQTQLEAQLAGMGAEVQARTAELAQLNTQVKALGEDEQLAVQAQIAAQDAELRQLQRQQTELELVQRTAAERIQHLQQQITQDQAQQTDLEQQHQALTAETLQTLTYQRNAAQQALAQIREQSQAIAASADAWVREQTQLRQQMETLLATLDPQRSELAQLQERVEQLGRQSTAQTGETQTLAQTIAETQQQLATAQTELENQQTNVQALAATLATTEETVRTTQDTQSRLQREQREKQRQLDQLEAKEEAQQEAQGTLATRVLLKADLSGVCGLVANLGRVEPQYQIALETAAGARMGHLVVNDDGVAAAGIELLKRERGGRATFLPLNKLRSAQDLPNLNTEGAIDYAIYLIDFDPKYDAVFAYVLGNTVVFESLNAARRYIGRYRMVTLEGDLLESTGAMTGGSRSSQQTLHFGHAETGESAELLALRQRLSEIDQVLSRIEGQLSQQQTDLADQTQALSTARQQHRETQFQVEQLTKDLQNLTQRREQLVQQSPDQELATARTRLQTLEDSIPQQESELTRLRAALVQLEQAPTHSAWQAAQGHIQAQENVLAEREVALREAQQQVQALELQQQRLQEKQAQAEAEIQQGQQAQATAQQKIVDLGQQQQQIQVQIAELQVKRQELEAHLGEAKQNRDRAEQRLQESTRAQQELTWQLQKLIETQQQQHTHIAELQQQCEAKAQELPDPLPELPTDLTLEALQEELRSLQRRIQAMEPVNMLAIEEYERTQARLEELVQKLTTLEAERTELLLRIENFTTLRQQSFKGAFDTVNTSFQKIFADLSDGDGYLELEDPEDPFRGGLNLVAHPKGKPVQRLASMSGGEKSLTALSFIFALQRYRPSPFYALDEVDSFLDGVNVERLARTIRQQAEAAQFIVVSHRRPMIEAADRTIGVTQARGTHTQVIGMQLRSSG